MKKHMDMHKSFCNHINTLSVIGFDGWSVNALTKKAAETANPAKTRLPIHGDAKQ